MYTNTKQIMIIESHVRNRNMTSIHVIHYSSNHENLDGKWHVSCWYEEEDKVVIHLYALEDHV